MPRYNKFIITILTLVMSLAFVGCTSIKGNAQKDNGNEGNPDIQNGINTSNPKNEPGDIGYVISFVVNGGVPIDNKTVTIVETSPVTTRVGFSFNGWYLSSTFNDQQITFPFYPSKDTTFYAKWLTLDTIKIKTAEDLQKINSGLQGTYSLQNDISLEGKEWVPIGSKVAPFKGIFDGNNFRITNLTLKPTESDEKFNHLPLGLFGWSIGTIRNTDVNTFNIELKGHLSRFYVGGLVGILENGSIINCKASGAIDNPESKAEDDSSLGGFVGSSIKRTVMTYFGGLVGYSQNGEINGCYSSGSIMSESIYEDVYVGGLVGKNEKASILNSHSTSSLKGKYVGGLAGFNDGEITNCYATGSVYGNPKYPTVVGGLVSENFSNGIISRSYASGNLIGETVGGLVGVNLLKDKTAKGAKIVDCYSSGSVDGSRYAGGLVGRSNYATMTNCFAFGKVTASFTNIYYTTYAGGLVAESLESTITDCVATGDVLAYTTRPPQVVGDTTTYYNMAISANCIGQNSSSLNKVYGLATQKVFRNQDKYSGFANSDMISIVDFNNAKYLTTTLHFDASVWDLTSLNFLEGKLPFLK